MPITITNSEGKEQTSLPVASLANKALDILGGSAGLIIMLLISFSAIMTVIFQRYIVRLLSVQLLMNYLMLIGYGSL